MDYQDSMF